MQKLFLLLILTPTFLIGQPSKKDSIWLSLEPLIGQWVGEGGGVSGKASYERSYQYILNKNFIEIKNKSTYQPTANNPKGEVHEDIGYFSYDKKIKKFKLRQFHIEGFVNEYELDSISADQKTFVFVTVGIENIPKGFRAKETYHMKNENEMEETFELAEPDKEFGVYSRVRLVRQK